MRASASAITQRNETPSISSQQARLMLRAVSLCKPWQIPCMELFAPTQTHLKCYSGCRWLKRFGNEATIRLLQHNNTPPAYGIRVNPARGMTVDKLLAALTEAGVDAERSPFLPHEFIRVHSGMQALLAQGWLSSGEIAVQDEAAGLVVALLDPSPGETLLDACAAPGGKTLFAAQRMHGSGRITAMDVSAGRLRALARAADAAGVRGMIEVVAADLREHAARLNAGAGHAETGGDAAVGESMQRTAAGSAEGAGSGRRRVNLARGQQSGSQLYDKVLLDAPCSGKSKARQGMVWSLLCALWLAHHAVTSRGLAQPAAETGCDGKRTRHAVSASTSNLSCFTENKPPCGRQPLGHHLCAASSSSCIHV